MYHYYSVSYFTLTYSTKYSQKTHCIDAGVSIWMTSLRILKTAIAPLTHDVDQSIFTALRGFKIIILQNT